MSHPNHLIGNPPVRDLAAKRIQQGLVVDGVALLRLYDEKRPLPPFGIGLADDGDQAYARQPADDGFDLDRIDPLAARFDQVLGPARDGEIAVIVDAGEVAGVEIAFAVEGIRFPL